MQRKYDLFIRKKKLIKTVPEKTQTLYLLGKDFKSTVLNMLKELKEVMVKELNKPGELYLII